MRKVVNLAPPGFSKGRKRQEQGAGPKRKSVRTSGKTVQASKKKGKKGKGGFKGNTTKRRDGKSPPGKTNTVFGWGGENRGGSGKKAVEKTKGDIKTRSRDHPKSPHQLKKKKTRVRRRGNPALYKNNQEKGKGASKTVQRKSLEKTKTEGRGKGGGLIEGANLTWGRGNEPRGDQTAGH